MTWTNLLSKDLYFDFCFFEALLFFLLFLFSLFITEYEQSISKNISKINAKFVYKSKNKAFAVTSLKSL